MRFTDDDRLPAVREVSQAGTLMAFFEDAYLKKFKVPYLSQVRAADETYLKDLIRKVGPLRAKTLIMKFFTMDTFTIKTKGHTIPVLMVELNNVNKAVGASSETRESPASSGLNIKVRFFCDGCGKDFELLIEPHKNAFDRKITCQNC